MLAKLWVNYTKKASKKSSYGLVKFYIAGSKSEGYFLPRSEPKTSVP